MGEIGSSVWWAKRPALLSGVLLVDLFLVFLGSHGAGTPMGDITLAYQTWANQLSQAVPWFGLGQDWVYPFPDLLFIWGPTLLPFDYQTDWLVVAVVMNLLATLALVGLRGPITRPMALGVWLWCGWTLLLGPVAVSRLDNISLALAIAAIGFWHRGRAGAAAAFTGLAIWVKIWPLALLLGWLTQRSRWRQVAVGACASLLGTFALGYLIAGPNHLLSFLATQSNRGLQIEAPAASLWLWNNQPGSSNLIYLHNELITYQIRGASADLVANWLGPVMYVALAITAFLGWRAMRSATVSADARATDARATDARAAVAWTALTATLDLIVFNKVGSPQYYGWLFAAGLLFVVWQLPSWTVVACWLAGLALLTQCIYPLLYDGIIQAVPSATMVLIARNLVVVALLIFANLRLTQLSSSSRSSGPTLSRSIKKPS